MAVKKNVITQRALRLFKYEMEKKIRAALYIVSISRAVNGRMFLSLKQRVDGCFHPFQ